MSEFASKTAKQARPHSAKAPPRAPETFAPQHAETPLTRISQPTFTPSTVQQLQHLVGNRATLRLIQRSDPSDTGKKELGRVFGETPSTSLGRDDEPDLQFDNAELVKEAEGYIEMIERERLLDEVKKKDGYAYLVNRFERLKSAFRTDKIITDFASKDMHSQRFLQRVNGWLNNPDHLPLLRSTYQEMRELVVSKVAQQLTIPTNGTLSAKLKDMLEQAEGPDISGIPLTFFRPLIVEATEEERTEVGQDSELLDALSERLAPKDLPRLMLLLEVRQQPKTGTQDPHGDITDRSIRADVEIMLEFKGLVQAAVTRGVEVLGRVVVLQGDDWVKVMKRLHPKDSKEDLQGVNAETTGGVIYLNADRGDEGTLIHEAIHQYAQDDFAERFGNELNEGATEFFARKITNRLNIPRNVYKPNIELITPIIAFFGEDVIARAYFQGAIDGMRSIFLNARLKQHNDPQRAIKEWDRLHDVLTLGMEYDADERKKTLRSYGLIP